METVKLLELIFTNTPSIANNKCIIDRAYRKSDIKKNPIIYSYLNLDELGEVFYCIAKSTDGFIKMSKDNFEKNFSCYEEDLIAKYNGKNPWDVKEVVSKEERLEASSGNISVDRSDER